VVGAALLIEGLAASHAVRDRKRKEKACTDKAVMHLWLNGLPIKQMAPMRGW
jgi:hypothetical protein